MARTIQSPGVEIIERDLSEVARLPVGTNVLVTGFADQGPSNELVNVTSTEEFGSIYGKPTNSAERYFYHTCNQILQTPANLLTIRLPYGLSAGSGFDGAYTALLFPVSGTALNSGETSASLSACSAFSIGEPVHLTLTQDDYINWEANNIGWTNSMQSTSSLQTLVNTSSATALSAAGFVIINDIKTTVNEKFEGYYIALADRRVVDTPTTFDCVSGVKTVYSNSMTGDTFYTLNESKLEFPVAGSTTIPNSLAEDIERIPSFELTTPDFDDTLILGLYRFRPSIYGTETDRLEKVSVEYYVGSLNKNRTQNSLYGGAPVSFCLADMVNNRSAFLKMYVNPYLAEAPGWFSSQGLYQGAVTATTKDAYALGSFVNTRGYGTVKSIGSLQTKLETAFSLVDNAEEIPLDIVCEGGLGTVFVGAEQNNPATVGTFDETAPLQGFFSAYPGGSDPTNGLRDATSGETSKVQNDYETIYNVFRAFVQDERKDCLLIADPLRNIFIQGENFKTLKDSSRTFSTHIYQCLRNLYAAANSNYACTYGNWVQVLDPFIGKYVWLPMSGWVAGIMGRLDANLQPWYAAAGLNNGIIRNIVDIAVNPSQKQRDSLYRVNINPVYFAPGDGFVVWGQKTLQKKPSAFDRINVRRLFLVLEKATMAITRYFVFEPNTTFTRTRLSNVLKPIFEVAKADQGLYDYMIVCNEKNNTADVIDNNELKVDIYIKPVRIAEFILVTFTCTKTSQNFSELVQ